MLRTKLEFNNGRPYISVNGRLYAPLAYTTYFEECGEFSDFIRKGYRMFFVNVSFTSLPINNVSGFSPFLTGVFDGDEPDYSELDEIVSRIISECPDAFIFPRINIAMPQKWIDENPDETVETQSGRRESLYSDAFRSDGAKLLHTLVSHIRSAGYAHRIAGYQLCGGTTQEWMHHDLFGSFSEMGQEKFRLWMQEKYGMTDIPSLLPSDFSGGEFNEIVSRYGEFCGEATAETVEYFAKALKKQIDGEQIVGVFYGYNAFVNDYLWGLHGLRFIVNSPYIDFFSSPCGYDNNRSLGVDWCDMLTSGSVKHHGKLYFVECDIRTRLTRRMQSSRPGRYPDDILRLVDKDGNKTVWSGPETQELSLSAMRKAFAHQLTKGSGIWWFDMWGGWYHDEELMTELEKMKDIAESSKGKNPEIYPSAQTVVFIDEKAYLNNPRDSHLCHCVNITRAAMGNTGIPFDLYMVEDAEEALHKYKAAIFPAPLPSESGKAAIDLCRKMNVPFIQADTEKSHFSTDELRDFLVSHGVHCYDSCGNVVYCGEGFLGIHTVNDGEINIPLPEKYKVIQILGTGFAECETELISLYMKKHDTVLFELI
ncbi:MAG: hypothetical protein E7555_04210 [Ruminococcaceae bacterium]|nr:hypothetical protein [Oscillospiraceae bacterium]